MGGQASVPPPSSPNPGHCPTGPTPLAEELGLSSPLQSQWTPRLHASLQASLRAGGPLPPGSPEARTPLGPPGARGAADRAEAGNLAGRQLQAPPRPPPPPLRLYYRFPTFIWVGQRELQKAREGSGTCPSLPPPREDPGPHPPRGLCLYSHLCPSQGAAGPIPKPGPRPPHTSVQGGGWGYCRG